MAVAANLTRSGRAVTSEADAKETDVDGGPGGALEPCPAGFSGDRSGAGAPRRGDPHRPRSFDASQRWKQWVGPSIAGENTPPS
jgi:hypothetical protein